MLVKNTLETRRDADAPAMLPDVAIRPKVRCYHRDEGPSSSSCGAIATRIRRGLWWFEDSFWCAEHALTIDAPIAGELAVRRVHLAVTVYLAGTSPEAGKSQAEAVARLTAAVAQAGGVLDVQSVRSTFVRYGLRPGARTGGRTSDNPE